MSIVEKAMRKRRERTSDTGAAPDATENPTAGSGDDGSSVARTAARARDEDGAAMLASPPTASDKAEAAQIAAFGSTATVPEEPAPALFAAESELAAAPAPAPVPEQGSETIGAGDASRPTPAQARSRSSSGPPHRKGVAPVLELSEEALRESGLLPAEQQTRHIDDQYRRIKRPLLARAFGINMPRLENGNLLMVASSLPGEGKSFTSFNLALSIARELDRTVLLVDADVAKPHLTRAMNLEEQRGLIDLLLDDDLDLQDVIMRTNIERLRFLPAGPLHRNSTELLASERMALLVKEVGARYPDRVILFDTPPLLPTTEAQAMAHLMGQIVVVVHAGHTPQSAVKQAMEMLAGAGDISFVLNKTRTAWGEEYNQYGNYRGYGYGVD